MKPTPVRTKCSADRYSDLKMVVLLKSYIFDFHHCQKMIKVLVQLEVRCKRREDAGVLAF